MGGTRKDALDLEILPETSTVKFCGPKRISYFSIFFGEDNISKCCPDNSSLKYLDETKLHIPINCLEGFNSKIVYEPPGGFASYFLPWIENNKETIRAAISQNNPHEKIDFICSNMELKHIMLSLYDDHGWRIHAFRNRTRSEIFLFLGHFVQRDEKTNEDIEVQPQYNPAKANRLSYARFDVIKKITKRVTERALNPETDIFSTISFSKIGQHGILHEGFTEFALSKDDVDKPIDQANFAALKLMKNLYKRDGDFNITFYRRMYWWASALVTGIKSIVCGDLEYNFTLQKLDVLPAHVLNRNTSQDRKKCLITLDKILDFIKSEVKEKNKVYDFLLNVETREVTVSPSEKYHVEDLMLVLGSEDDIPDQANP